eukprot:365796-Chlamydomonas_euryale.AAC.21
MHPPPLAHGHALVRLTRTRPLVPPPPCPLPSPHIRADERARGRALDNRAVDQLCDACAAAVRGGHRCQHLRAQRRRRSVRA